MSDFADKSFDMIERLQKRIAELEKGASGKMIEAAEIAEEHAGRTAGSAQYALEDLAAALRARAGDRSGE